jgi:diguanylate cyclase
MPAARPRDDELQTLAALRALSSTSSAPDPEFDALARAASLLCGTPIALVSLIDAERQWFKAQHGLPDLTETPREQAFCAHAVLGDALLEVNDATLEPRFADNPFVTGAPEVRFYAGAPLRLTGGHRVGTLCVVDTAPRTLNDAQREGLRCLAQLATHALENRRSARQMQHMARAMAQAELLHQHSADAIVGVAANGSVLRWNPAAAELLGYSREQIIGQSNEILVREADRPAQRELLVRAMSGQAQTYDTERLHRDGTAIAVAITLVPEFGPAGQWLGATAFMRDNRERDAHMRALAHSEARLRNIIEGTQAATWEWHVPSGELRVNERWAQMLGRAGEPQAPLNVQTYQKLAHPNDAEEVGQLLRQHLAGGSEHFECELRMRHQAGHWVWLLARGRVMSRLPATAEKPNGRAEWMFGTLQDISLRRQQQLALRHSEALLDRTGRLAGVGGWELDVASSAVTWSDETRRIHGLPPSYQPSLAGAIDFYAPEARPLIQAAVERGMNSGEPWDLELPLMRADGQRIWVRAIGTVEFADGKPSRLSGAFQDITERRTMQQRLIDNERFLRQVVDSVPGLIAHIDLHQCYTLVNEAYLQWDHRSQREIVGRSVAQVHGAAAYALLGPELERALAGHTAHFEVELQRGDEVRAMQVTYVPDLDEAGTVRGVFSLKVDVTALRRAEQKLRAVMDASPLGMFVSDAHGASLFVNAAWQRISGVSFDHSMGAGWRDAVHPDDLGRVDTAWAAAFASGQPQLSEHRYRRADGGVIWIRRHVAPIATGSYHLGAVGTVEDITERRVLDQALAAQSAALARSNEDLERFAYVASHDLQEPLRMVTSYGQLLVRRHAEELSPQAREFMQFMVDGGQRAQALIRDLLSVARVDSQAQAKKQVPVQRVLTATLHGLRLMVQDSAAQISHDDLPSVWADERQLGQVLHNLLHNALKFRGAAPPAIHISARHELIDEQPHWRIGVRDNGIGIEPRFFERVFVMFQRLHLRSEHEGTGIGLAVCKKIVERHGGRIGVSSDKGQGSEFFFTLPDAEPAPAPTQPPHSEATRPEAQTTDAHPAR